jgi:hypothetical protein
MDALRAEGWFCFKVHGTELVMAGLPDIICCAEGLFIGLETKNPETRNKEGSHERTQARVHEKIHLAGGVAQVVVTPEEAVEVVRLALRRAKKPS